MSNQSPKAFQPAIQPPEEIHLSENSRQVLKKRYLRKGLDGQPIETIAGMFRRVAHAVAEPDAAHGYDAASTEDSFYGLLTSLRFFPNSPTFTGAGTPLGQLAACFVLPITDDLGKQAEGIFQTLRDAALIQQTGGGNGFSFSRLRPKADSVASSAGVASGPVGFLRVYDSAFGEVAQGGTRRGANMAVLRVDHPDIEEFIACKAREGHIANFNISVGITDSFMRAVDADSDFPLVNPRDGKVWRTVRARDLFDKIVTYAHHNGEPGALFLDAANRGNPVPHLYVLEATNPCGEQWLGPYENCCLGSINLAQHVTADSRVDWEKLRESTVVSTRFLDNVVDANQYVPAVPQLREAAVRARRIGLGIMGLGDIMYLLGSALRIGGGPGVRCPNHGIRAFPLHGDQHRARTRARCFPGHPRQHLRSAGLEMDAAPSARPLPTRLGPAGARLEPDRSRHPPGRDSQRGANHRCTYGYHRHCGGLRRLRLRTGLRIGLYSDRQGRRP